jgi:murein DD-endopeptidase MepM/ murein hydrolase activator NlpD
MLRLLTRYFPPQHIFAAGFVALFILVILALIPSTHMLEEQTEYKLELDDKTDSPATPVKEAAAPTWPEQVIVAGDNMAKVFVRAGLSSTDLHYLGQTKDKNSLTRIHPGDVFSYLTDDAGALQKAKLTISPLESYTFERIQDGFTSEHVIRTPNIQYAYGAATINSSLFLAGQEANLSQNIIMQMADIFSYDVDFSLDIRNGDRFELLYEELLLDGEKIKNGNIVAARFITSTKYLTAIRYDDGTGNSSYYDPKGLSMRKAFMRNPVDFSRISSKFNLKRRHPILHKIRAHKGVDYAAKRGTPIKAVGNGKIIWAGTRGGYGRTVILQHGQRYTTLYAHLNKYGRNIKTGRYVEQGQIIGYVGSSGLASGPHLHYEFRINGTHKNPLTVRFPNAKPIPAKQRGAFKIQAKEILEKMATFKQAYNQ